LWEPYIPPKPHSWIKGEERGRGRAQKGKKRKVKEREGRREEERTIHLSIQIFWLRA